MTRNLKNYHILVIEDNIGDYVLIKDYLEEQIADPNIVHVRNFAEARNILTGGTVMFDVILLDLSLTDKSGEELIVDIISLAADIPVIILTGYSDIDFSIRSLSLGVADYLLKEDINSSSLFKSILYTIERKKLNAELRESQKRYSDVFLFHPQPMWIVDPETNKFIQANLSAEKLYGYTEDEFLHMTIFDVRSPEDIPTLRNILKNWPDESKGVAVSKITHRKKNDELIEVDVYINPITINNKIYRLVVAIDITEKILFENKITKAIIKTQEDERYEIGGELHDNVCQILATSLMSLRMMKDKLSPADIEWYNQGIEYITLASDEIRNLSHRLAPAFFDECTLEETFTILLNSINMEKNYTISLTVDTEIHINPPNRETQLNLYRILQEQLRNIVKYAQATKIEVSLFSENNFLKMKITDNGKGFDITSISKGIGISNMRRRAELFNGSVQIDSCHGCGCTVLISIPQKEINTPPDA